MRLFVALPVPAHVQEHVREAVAPWWDDGRVAWTRPAGWHVTLAFLGEVDAPTTDVVDAVRAGCAADGVEEIVLVTASTARLGRGALALQVDETPAGAVAALGAGVQSALEAAGLPVHRRPVRAHLTLGRARRRRPVPDDLLEAVRVPPARWTADRVELVESILGRGPADYAPVATVGLTAGAG